MIGVSTDSGSQLPRRFAAALCIDVVPLTVTVAGREYLEGVDLTVDQLYDLLEDDDAELTIDPPSPGQCAATYEEIAARGCTAILAVHSSLADASAINAARLAARSSPVPVRIVDCGTVSFGVGCCAGIAGEAALAGASIDEAVALVEALVPRLDHVFTTGRPDPGETGFYVATGVGEAVEALTCAPTEAAAVAAMAAYVLRRPGPLRVGIGAGARSAIPLADELEQAVRADGRALEVVRYRIGGGLARRMRPGTVGCFSFTR